MYENIVVVYQGYMRDLHRDLIKGGLDIKHLEGNRGKYFSCALGEIFISRGESTCLHFHPADGHERQEIISYTLGCLGVDTAALAKLFEVAAVMDSYLSNLGEAICGKGCSNLGFKIGHQRTIGLHFN